MTESAFLVIKIGSILRKDKVNFRDLAHTFLFLLNLV